MDTTCGGWAKTKAATADVQKICDHVKSQVETKTKKTYQEFKAIEYRSQVVAGVFYLIKVEVGGGDYLQIYVFQGPVLLGHQETKLGRVEHCKQADPLVHSLPYL